MRFAYVVLPLLVLAGCSTTAMGPRAHNGHGQSMENCPMASGSGEQQHGGMMGERAGQMMSDGQMMQNHQGMMRNCPMAQGSATPAPPPTDSHQH